MIYNRSIQTINTKFRPKHIFSQMQDVIRNGDANRYFEVGDEIPIRRGSSNIIYQIPAIDYDYPIDSQYTHSMRLLMKNCFTNIPFCPQQAIYYAASTLTAGTYWFLDSRTSKYCSFTTTINVPSGGQIVMTFGANPFPFTSAKTYASQTSTTEIETIAATISDTIPGSGTHLTTINDGSRARWGSNNWLNSAMRQYLNSPFTAGWNTAKTIYDHPQFTLIDGFLNGIDEDLLACIGNVRLRTVLNPVDNEGTVGYADNEETIFLPSCTEIGLGNSVTNVYETPVTADGTAKTSAMPLFNSNADRIKYLSGTASYWWMRSPYPTVFNTQLTYVVNPFGILDNYYSFGARGAVPACVIY